MAGAVIEARLGSGHALALWAVPDAAWVRSTPLIATGVTAGFVAAQGRRVAQLDGPERPVLLTAQSLAIALQEGLAMLAHDIGDFAVGATHQTPPTHGLHIRVVKPTGFSGS